MELNFQKKQSIHFFHHLIVTNIAQQCGTQLFTSFVLSYNISIVHPIALLKTSLGFGIIVKPLVGCYLYLHIFFYMWILTTLPLIELFK